MLGLTTRLFLLSLVCLNINSSQADTIQAYDLSFSTQQQWTLWSTNKTKTNQRFTLDGKALNELILLSHIRVGDSLSYDSRTFQKATKYTGNYSNDEFESWLKKCLPHVIKGSISSMSIEPLQKQLGQDKGYKLQLELINPYGLIKQVQAIALERSHKFYLVAFVAPKIHYAKKIKPDIQTAFETLSIGAKPST